MAKAVKTKHRRLKRTVRKTLGTIFLISALLVAAIPVENLQAVDGNATPMANKQPDVHVDINQCGIPLVDNNAVIYTTGDGMYQFAYVQEANSNSWVAVILGYGGNYLTGNALTVPDTVDAFLKYSTNLGTERGYVAVGRSGNFLYHAKKDTDVSGNDIITGYEPCYYESRDSWESLGVEEFYYYPNNIITGTPQPTTTSPVQRIQDAQVRYIGNQYLNAGTGADEGTWTVGGIITSPEQGVFANKANIVSLIVGNNLSGIGTYAFYSCASLGKITLSNALNTICDSAFEECVNLNEVDIDFNSNLNAIGARAFYNCNQLKTFAMPVNVDRKSVV